MKLKTIVSSVAVAFIALALVNPAAAALKGGFILVPNIGLNALQEINPTNGNVVAVIPVPAGYAFSVNGIVQLNTALVRPDGTIFTNALDAAGNPVVLALSSSGALLAAQDSGGQFLQQLAFDPLDSTRSTVLGGIPFSPEIVAVNPFAQTTVPRITFDNGNFIGLAVQGGYIFCSNFSDGIVHRFHANGSGGAAYVNVGEATGSGEANGITFAGPVLYVAQNSSERIAVFKGTTLAGFITNGFFNHPSTVFYSAADQHLFVGNQNDGYLTVLTTAGVPVYSVNLGGSGIGVAAVIPKQN